MRFSLSCAVISSTIYRLLINILVLSFADHKVVNTSKSKKKNKKRKEHKNGTCKVSNKV